MWGTCCSSCSGTTPRAKGHHQHPTLTSWFAAPHHPQVWYGEKTPCCHQDCVQAGLQTVQLCSAPFPDKDQMSPGASAAIELWLSTAGPTCGVTPIPVQPVSSLAQAVVPHPSVRCTAEAVAQEQHGLSVGWSVSLLAVVVTLTSPPTSASGSGVPSSSWHRVQSSAGCAPLTPPWKDNTLQPTVYKSFTGGLKGENSAGV